MAATAPARKRDRHHRQIRRIEMQANSQDLSKICQRGSQRSTTAGPAGCERPAARQPAPPTDKAGPDCKFIHKFGTEPAGTGRAWQYDRATSPAPRAHSSTMIKFILRILVVAIVSFFVAYFMGGPEPELFLQAADRERRPARGARRTACPAQRTGCHRAGGPGAHPPRGDRAAVWRRHPLVAPGTGPARRQGARPAHPPGRGLSRTTASISFPCPASRRNGCRCANPATALPTGCWRGAHGCS